MDTPQKSRIGLMGGTFDPIHFGHLYIAECSRFKFNLDKVLFIPTGKPVHKKRTDIVNSSHRLMMTRLAVDSNRHFEVSAIEMERLGPTYTVDTLKQLHNDTGGTNEYYFITGADAILEIFTWKDVNHIFDLCQFIAVTRPGISLDGLNQMLQNLSEDQREKIHIHETSGIFISSTEIRERVRTGEPIKYLLPDDVEKYIAENNLYLG